MTEPKAKSEKPDEPGEASPEELARVRETLGEGLRKFYDSVLDEPIPPEWLNIVGGAAKAPPQ